MSWNAADKRRWRPTRNGYFRPSPAESECGARNFQAAANSSPKGTDVNTGCQPTEHSQQFVYGVRFSAGRREHGRGASADTSASPKGTNMNSRGCQPTEHGQQMSLDPEGVGQTYKQERAVPRRDFPAPSGPGRFWPLFRGFHPRLFTWFAFGERWRFGHPGGRESAWTAPRPLCAFGERLANGKPAVFLFGTAPALLDFRFIRVHPWFLN